MTTHRFPRTARVRARPDFDRIFKQGRRVALPVLALHWTAPAAVDASDERSEPEPESGRARLGLAVSRKVDRRAVGRNRVKRVLREAFRQRRALLRDGDYVVVARPGASTQDTDQLRQAFLNLLQRAGALSPTAAALPAPAVPGTMPAPSRTDDSPPNDPAPVSGAGRACRTP